VRPRGAQIVVLAILSCYVQFTVGAHGHLVRWSSLCRSSAEKTYFDIGAFVDFGSRREDLKVTKSGRLHPRFRTFRSRFRIDAKGQQRK
jgi:hypothetical protein